MELKVQLFDLVLAFSRMLDKVMPELAGHNTRVGFLTCEVGKIMNISAPLRQTITIAGLLHDVGALPLRVSSDDLVYERNRDGHSIAGERLLLNCAPLYGVSESVRHHHTPWKKLDPQNAQHRLAALLGLADRVDVFVHSYTDSRTLFAKLHEHIRHGAGTHFCPLHAEAMDTLLEDKDLCERILHDKKSLVPQCQEKLEPISMNDARDFSRFMGHVIDSRSPFTATHSVGVAQTACVLSRLAGIDEKALNAIYIAGMLHDIGKLDIPLRILEKAGPLTRDEAAVMSSHASLSEEWLNAIPGFEKVSRWGALHHERMNGSGYPHGHRAETLELPSRVMAVADVFTAITEDRPYRLGMPLKKAMEILNTMAHTHLDPELVKLVLQNSELIDSVRREAQEEAHCLYNACRDVPAEPDCVIGDSLCESPPFEHLKAKDNAQGFPQINADSPRSF